MIRPRLLFLGHTLPYPPDRGAALRSYHVLRELATRYEVDALFFRRRREPTRMALEDRVRHLEKIANVEVFAIPAERSATRRRWDQLRSVVRGQSEAEWRYDDPVYRRSVLEKVFRRDPEVIHVDSVMLHSYLSSLVDRTVVLAHQGPEKVHIRTREEETGVPAPGFLDRQAEWLAGAEREWVPRVAMNLVSSPAERSALLELAPNARVETVPPAVDTRHFTPSATTGHGLAFIGGTTGRGGRDALAYFTAEILPRLRKVSGVKAIEPISWIGMAREGDRERYRALGIDVTGHVEDLRPILRPTACFIVPRRIPGGSARVLQAWAMGKAVVSTSVGVEGLEAVDEQNILIRDDADSFARAVLDVIEDGTLRRRLGEAGRKTVEERYSWEQRGRELIALYQEIEEVSRTPPDGDTS